MADRHSPKVVQSDLQALGTRIAETQKELNLAKLRYDRTNDPIARQQIAIKKRVLESLQATWEDAAYYSSASPICTISNLGRGGSEDSKRPYPSALMGRARQATAIKSSEMSKLLNVSPPAVNQQENRQDFSTQFSTFKKWGEALELETFFGYTPKLEATTAESLSCPNTIHKIICRISLDCSMILGYVGRRNRIGTTATINRISELLGAYSARCYVLSEDSSYLEEVGSYPSDKVHRYGWLPRNSIPMELITEDPGRSFFVPKASEDLRFKKSNYVRANKIKSIFVFQFRSDAGPGVIFVNYQTPVTIPGDAQTFADLRAVVSSWASILLSTPQQNQDGPALPDQDKASIDSREAIEAWISDPHQAARTALCKAVTSAYEKGPAASRKIFEFWQTVAIDAMFDQFSNHLLGEIEVDSNRIFFRRGWLDEECLGDGQSVSSNRIMFDIFDDAATSPSACKRSELTEQMIDVVEEGCSRVDFFGGTFTVPLTRSIFPGGTETKYLTDNSKEDIAGFWEFHADSFQINQSGMESIVTGLESFGQTVVGAMTWMSGITHEDHNSGFLDWNSAFTFFESLVNPNSGKEYCVGLLSEMILKLSDADCVDVWPINWSDSDLPEFLNNLGARRSSEKFDDLVKNKSIKDYQLDELLEPRQHIGRSVRMAVDPIPCPYWSHDLMDYPRFNQEVVETLELQSIIGVPIMGPRSYRPYAIVWVRYIADEFRENRCNPRDFPRLAQMIQGTYPLVSLALCAGNKELAY